MKDINPTTGILKPTCMTIQFFAPQWGNTLPFDTFCHNVKAAGYNGVEMGLPFDTHLNWWDKVVDRHRKENKTTTAQAAEFL